MGKVLAICNRKGGCGKTMTTVSLGAALAAKGKRVLAIDADSQHSARKAIPLKNGSRI